MGAEKFPFILGETMDEIDALETGIELLVVLQYGCNAFLNSMDCAECSEEECIANGCTLGNRPIVYMDEPLYIKHTNKEYFNCPISLIPSIVYRLYDRYSRMKGLNQHMGDDDTSGVYWWFVKTYERAVADIKSQMHDDITKKNNVHT